MNYDAMKVAELEETRRANRAKEGIEAHKAQSARITARSKQLESIGKAAGGLLGGITGRNDKSWDVPQEAGSLEAGRLSFVSRQVTAAEAEEVQDAGVYSAPFAVMNYEFTLGRTQTGVDPVTLAFKEMYDAWRGRNRGSTNFTVNDVITYFFPVYTIAVEATKIERLLKVLSYYKGNDAYVGDSMAAVMGFNANSLRENLANLKDQYKLLQNQLAAFPLPDDSHVLKRHIYLNSLVFVDDKEHVHQYYLVCQNSYHALANYGRPTRVTQAVVSPIRCVTQVDAELQDANDLLTLMRTLSLELRRLMLDTTFQAIAGDIYNYTGENPKNSFGQDVDWDSDIIVYDEEFLLQIRNLYGVHALAGSRATQNFGLLLGGNGHIQQGVLIGNTIETSRVEAFRAMADRCIATTPKPLYVTLPHMDSLGCDDVFLASQWKVQHDKKFATTSWGYIDTDGTLKSYTYSQPSVALTCYGTELPVFFGIYVGIAPGQTAALHYEWVAELEGDNSFYETADGSYLMTSVVRSALARFECLPMIRLSLNGEPPFEAVNMVWYDLPDVHASSTDAALNNVHALSLLQKWNVSAKLSTASKFGQPSSKVNPGFSSRKRNERSEPKDGASSK